jgi:glycine cleavage system regulatory protein
VNVDKFEVPLTKQPPLNPLVNGSVLAAGKPPQVTVISARAVIVGNAAGLTVIVLETEVKARPQLSVAVQVSVTVPPQAPGVAENVDEFEVPLIKQPSPNPLVNEIVLAAGKLPQATVMSPGAVIVGNAAGLIVIILETGAKTRPQLSVAVHVSVTVPPQAPGVGEKVEGFEVPLIKHPPLKPLVNGIVLAAGKPPQATVVFPGAVMVGNAAGLIVIVLD